MGSAKQIGRVGALAAALGPGNARRTAARMTVSVGVAALVVTATVVPVPTPTPAVSPAVRLSSVTESSDSDTTALILCGTTCPTPDDFWVDSVMNQYIAPTHPVQPGQTITPVKVTAPMEFWPITGLFRILLLALGPASIWGPGGPGWPDKPLWKLSGLFDLTADQSLQGGVVSLEDALAEHPDDHVIIYGNSQGAGIANVVKHRLAEQYPVGTPEGANAPDIDFVLGSDPNLPNGGLMSRFPGLYIPIVNLTFNGPAATDTPFDTVEINRQYDGFSDFPLYPLNVVADLNAVLGIVYVHAYGFDVSLPAEHPTESPAYQGKHGDTDYYFFESDDLPLFGPLRTMGVPEKYIDVVEPFFKVIVEQGYDRSIPPWEPTPARLIPPLNPGKLATDLGDALGEGIDNAAALVGSPPPPASPGKPTQAFVSDLATLGHDTDTAGQQSENTVASQGREVENTVTPQGRETKNTVVSRGRDQDAVSEKIRSAPGTTLNNGPRKTPVRDAFKNAGRAIKKAFSKGSDSRKKPPSGGEADDDHAGRPEGAAG